jgi:hypothetical protein
MADSKIRLFLMFEGRARGVDELLRLVVPGDGLPRGAIRKRFQDRESVSSYAAALTRSYPIGYNPR